MFGRLLDYVMGILAALLRKLSTMMPMMLPPACVIVDFGKLYLGPSCFEEGDEVTAGGYVYLFVQEQNNGKQLMEERIKILLIHANDPIALELLRLDYLESPGTNHQE